MKVPRVYLLTAALVIPLAVGSFLLLDRFVWNQRLPEGLIQANGRIEDDYVTVASKLPGRVQQLLVREGAMVTVGQVLIQLGGRPSRARVDQATNAVEAHEAQAAHTTLAVLNLDVPLAVFFSILLGRRHRKVNR